MLTTVKQYTDEWFSLRANKIGASDVSIIMRLSPWKTPLQLYEEKLGLRDIYISEAMKRGSTLETIALEHYCNLNDSKMESAVFTSDDCPWILASLDGYDKSTGKAVEIKCPRNFPSDDEIPTWYYAQMQCQMYCADLKEIDYFVYVDDFQNKTIKCKRDDAFIDDMIVATKVFWDRLQNFDPPDMTEKDYVNMSHNLEFEHYASQYLDIDAEIKRLTQKKEELKTTLVNLSGNQSAKGCRIKVVKCQRVGSIDYSKIPELVGVNLDSYRKPSMTYWQINTKSDDTNV